MYAVFELEREYYDDLEFHSAYTTREEAIAVRDECVADYFEWNKPEEYEKDYIYFYVMELTPGITKGDIYIEKEKQEAEHILSKKGGGKKWD